MSNKMKNVDVIIPVHGTPIYLLETIESISDQQFVNKIIIVLDRVDKKYFSNLEMNQTNLVIVQSNTPGIVSALNTGLEISTAEFVARIDSDDMMGRKRIQTQLDFFAANPKCVCVGSYIEIFDSNPRSKIRKYPISHKEIINQLTYQNAMAHPSVMFRRKAVLEVGGYRSFFEGSEDYDLWFRLSKVGQLNNINIPLTKYRLNPGQYSSKFSAYRVELDSLVRLLNSWARKDFANVNYSQTPTGQQVKEYYQNFLKQVKKDDYLLYKNLISAQRFSIVLNHKNIKIRNISAYLIFILLIFRLLLMSPILSLRILIGRYLL
jgi:glycosyltransferase involved in cell wall biosynthesis